MKTNKKENLRHYLQNVFTILNFKIDELDLPDVQRVEFLELVKSASLIVENEDVFLGEKPDFFMQNVSVADLVMLACSAFQKDAMEQGVKIDLLDTGYEVSVDKNRFIDALKVIIAKILVDSSFLSFDFDRENLKLLLSHSSEQDLELKDYSFDECFSVKEFGRDKIMYLLALKVLDYMGVKLEFLKNTVLFSF